MKLIVSIPSYNEEKTVGDVVKKIPRRIEGIDQVQVIVVDGGSTDKTVQVAKEAGAEKVIYSKTREGLALGFKRGLYSALEMEADIIVNIDADNQYDPAEIPALIKPVIEGEADLVLGSRFKGYIEDMPLQRRIGNKIATYVTRTLSGVQISDAQTGFRAFGREAAMKLNILSNYTYTQETIIQAAYKKLKIVEVPINFRRREEGKSRLILNLFDYAKKAGLTVLLTYLNYKPLKTFVYMGLSLMAVGILVGLRVMVHYLVTGSVTPYLPSAVLTAILLIVGFQVSILGLYAEMIRSNRELLEDILYKLKEKA